MCRVPSAPSRHRPDVPDPDSPDPRLGDDVAAWPTGRLLSTAARMVEQRWNEGLAAYGLTHAGFATLAHLSTGSMTQHQVAELTHVEDQTMSRTLDRLQREGHVTRETDPDDRRRRVVALTPTGRAAFVAVLDDGPDLRIVDDTVAAQTDLDGFRRALVALVTAHGARDAHEQPA